MKKRHDIFFAQLDNYRSDLLAALEGITDEMADKVPAGFRNNIRWNMGHVYVDQYLWIAALTKDMSNIPETFQKWFGFGTSPADFTKETPSFTELKELLKIQPNSIKNTYGNRLEEEFSPTEMGMYTIEQVLIRTIFHEGMHFQAILDIKKSL